MAGRLKWRLTWEDRPQDFIASDPETGETVARMYIMTMPGSETVWRCFGNGQRNGQSFTLTVTRSGKQEAADALADAWEAFKLRADE